MAEAEGDFYAAYDDYIDDDEISPEEAGFMAGYEGMDKEEAEDSDNDLGPLVETEDIDLEYEPENESEGDGEF